MEAGFMSTGVKEMQETNNKAVSQNPLDYKQFVLYIIPTDQNCFKIMELAFLLQEVVHVEDIQKLQSRPAWLKGVPTLVHIKSMKPLYGSEAFATLDRFRNLFVKTPEVITMAGSSTINDAIASMSNRPATQPAVPQPLDNIGSSPMCFGSITPFMGNDDRYTGGGKHIKDDDMNTYLARRNKVPAPTKAVTGQKSDMGDDFIVTM